MKEKKKFSLFSQLNLGKSCIKKTEPIYVHIVVLGYFLGQIHNALNSGLGQSRNLEPVLKKLS
jgi:hypothetical protein